MKLKRSIHLRLNLINFVLAVILAVAVGFLLAQATLAEQSGSSPESGATSRFKTLYDEVTSLDKGSTSSGSWGDWGAMWNRIYSAAISPSTDISQLYNGTGYGTANCTTTFDSNCYTQAVGGVDDDDDSSNIPPDSYQVTWVACVSGNSFCGTGRDVGAYKDPNTGLVWGPSISASSNWFTANNCSYPNGLTGSDGVCNTANEIACYCVKKTSSKTGCEAYDDGNWRLPHQKEMMQAYIDGIRGSGLSDLTSDYWSATTLTTNTNTQYAYYQRLYNGVNPSALKTNNLSVRCVRPGS